MESKIEVANTNRQKCSVCKRCIPKEIERLNIGPQNNNGLLSQKRVCGLCIMNVYKRLNKKPIKKWCAEMVAKAI